MGLSPAFFKYTKMDKALDHVDVNGPMIGRIASTAGQAFAFATPFNAKHRDAASTLLGTALNVADTPEDVLRQSVYLAHFYPYSLLGGNDPEVKQEIDGLVRDTIHYIAEHPLVSGFIRRPFPDTPLSCVPTLFTVRA